TDGGDGGSGGCYQASDASRVGGSALTLRAKKEAVSRKVQHPPSRRQLQHGRFRGRSPVEHSQLVAAGHRTGVRPRRPHTGDVGDLATRSGQIAELQHDVVAASVGSTDRGNSGSWCGVVTRSADGKQSATGRR